MRSLLLLPLLSSMVLADSSTSFNPLTATVQELSPLIASGELTPSSVLNTYLHEISTYDGYLKSIIEKAPLQSVRKIAAQLDKQPPKSAVHGMVMVVKDSLVTDPKLGMQTTAGSFALEGSIPTVEQPSVTKLRKAGAIIIGKSNLSVWSYFRASFGDQPSGWSPRGGQTKSAFDPALDPSGSSTGSAVAVSAGLATFSLGEETDGSIISPANRAALYAIKPTVGELIPGSAVPISHNMDSVGVMAKGSWDVAAVQVIMDGRETEYMEAIAQGKKGWKGIKIGLANRGFYYNTTRVEKEIVDGCLEKIEKMKSLGAEIVDVEMPGAELVEEWTDQWVITHADFKEDIAAYLRTLKNTTLRSLGDLITYNNEHADVEMPPGHCCQDIFLASNASAGSNTEEYRTALRRAHYRSRDLGIDYALKKYGVDAIMAPSEVASTLPAIAGYPIITVPVAVAEIKNVLQPFGLSFSTTAHGEDKLFRIMAAWEKSFPDRPKPDMKKIPRKQEKNAKL
ncbi:amidase signature domain-containing protein [Pyronema omphalodes]|nr:amidase signature domain-containing protein [Pyronema omphalodes]